ncbi:MAG TPA: FAD binding domain-containing protein [Ktedonobacteraceae bacterium]|nr:FAD binding domain-containing protein [Ktedonobacteraceae bacterium]
MPGTRPHVLIMGGSLAGLTAALTLRDAGCDVEVYERSNSPLTGLGAGIVLNPATVRYFTEHSVLDISQISVAARRVRYMDRDGNIADDKPYAYRFSSYNALYQGLLNCFVADRYHLGESIVDFDQDNEGVNVRFASGRSERCDLLVCADGIRSTGRRLLHPGVSLEYAGYIAWRGTVGEAELSPHTFAALRDAITYHIMPDSHFLTYPIPIVESSSRSTQPLVNWLWYRNVSRGSELDDLTTDRDGIAREVSLYPGSVQERHVEKLRKDAATILPPPLTEVVRNTSQPFIQIVYDCEIPGMAYGRVCLIGDAAFVARPHAAAGTAKAAEDAWKLSEAVRETGGDVVAALRRWEPGQMELSKAVLARTREAGQRLQFEGSWQVGEQLPFGLYAVGDSVMPEMKAHPESY